MFLPLVFPPLLPLSQVVCRGCKFVSEREEEFVSLSVDVKDQASLTHSLAAFVKGDLLEGDNAYHCSRCGKKVTIDKLKGLYW